MSCFSRCLFSAHFVMILHLFWLFICISPSLFFLLLSFTCVQSFLSFSFSSFFVFSTLFLSPLSASFHLFVIWFLISLPLSIYLPHFFVFMTFDFFHFVIVPLFHHIPELPSIDVFPAIFFFTFQFPYLYFFYLLLNES